MKVILCFCAVLTLAMGQRITTIQLDGVQYFVSRMNPYSPELNYFLAYQYCRSLGLQLASFETKEKVESMTQYLQNAGYSKYDFWTSGNRLGTGMFLWMSTGLPFNATFDYFENSSDGVASSLEQVDHNQNTAPQRTARDSSSGLEKGCVVMQAPSLHWAPEDCSAVKDFICEQTRCYYYNYGSIPVSSAQGRPISSTTTTTTTPVPHFLPSTTFKMPLAMTLNLRSEPKLLNEHPDRPVQVETVTEEDEEAQEDSNLESEESSVADDVENEETTEELDVTEEVTEITTKQPKSDTITPVEQRLKQITEEIEKFSNSDVDSDIGRQSFFSLSDLIKNLRPNDKKTPQIDSDYSNTMRVLGDTKSLINEDARKVKEANVKITRSLY
ncbi:uncharacterized protein LOC129803526 isoform X1 [Phlebotomus papatasi]|uniref:uncharacterized protein LOC129803526 isoform X1 n=1 Tax=Phlebotomus papatasi TaxID=29031 RepID=UPI002483A6B5|nr:uncharacterized protein LOC129803526 isoform X1 [Phlebotomus papatasi]